MSYSPTTWTNNVTAVNAVNLNHIEDGLVGLDGSKVEKVETVDEVAAYFHDGATQGVKIISNTPGNGQLPMYDASNRLKCALPDVDGDVANKEYVDDNTGALTDNEIDAAVLN